MLPPVRYCCAVRQEQWDDSKHFHLRRNDHRDRHDGDKHNQDDDNGHIDIDDIRIHSLLLLRNPDQTHTPSNRTVLLSSACPACEHRGPDEREGAVPPVNGQHGNPTQGERIERPP